MSGCITPAWPVSMHSAVATADHFTGAGNPAADNANMRLRRREICQSANRLGKIYSKQYFFWG
jgi:hypothetical protein